MAEPFIVGDTFSYTVPFVFRVNGVELTDLDGWTAESQLRTDDGELIAELDVEWLSRYPTVLGLSYTGSTQDWWVGDALIDVQFTDPDGNKKSTKRGILPIVNDVTRPENG
jgi:hypothetical protein